MVRLFFLVLIITPFFTSCSKRQNIVEKEENYECIQGINLMPMYGHVKKCKEQIESDKNFLQLCEQQFGNLKKASAVHVDMGWHYFKNGDTETAMKRFNQAWLLDSLNSNVYWGFGVIEGKLERIDESIKLLNRSVKLNPENALVWQSLAVMNGEKYKQENDFQCLETMVEHLKKSIALSFQHEESYRLLTVAYCDLSQQDSAFKYMQITDQMNPKLIDADLRKKISRMR